MRQGAVLSPILYAVFTSDLLYNLERSGLGTHIDNIYYGSPTYADDMALVSHSPTDLQLMLDIVSEYAHTWEYTINPNKSHILIFSSQSLIRHHLAQHFTWKVGGHAIPISETVKHLGILLSSSSNSTIERTTNRISSARSSFYALSTIGARHSGINPVTSLTLFKSLSLPILSFGLEIWIPTDTELLLMERCQLKILRTILGLPTRSPSAGIHLLLGTIPVQVLSIVEFVRLIKGSCLTVSEIWNSMTTLFPVKCSAMVTDKRLGLNIRI